uniref:Uncharacterized protein n=1 Tax=Leersia perrieri TaxID=77586 RepID=A0A0D9XCP9_9ORYZ
MADEGGDLLAGGEPIRPPRLEDAGLEDCALPPESIAEAFSLAAMAVSSRLTHLSLSSDEEDDGLVGVGGDRGSGGADEVVVVGGGGEGGDEVVVGGRGDEEDRVVVVGEEKDGKFGSENGCVDGIREGIDELGSGEDDGEKGKDVDDEEEVVVAVEKAILVEDFARDILDSG